MAKGYLMSRGFAQQTAEAVRAVKSQVLRDAPAPRPHRNPHIIQPPGTAFMPVIIREADGASITVVAERVKRGPGTWDGRWRGVSELDENLTEVQATQAMYTEPHIPAEQYGGFVVPWPRNTTVLDDVLMAVKLEGEWTVLWRMPLAWGTLAPGAPVNLGCVPVGGG